MKVLDALITRIGQEYHFGSDAKFALFEECKIMVTPFCESGTKDFAVFLVN